MNLSAGGVLKRSAAAAVARSNVYAAAVTLEAWCRGVEEAQNTRRYAVCNGRPTG